VSMTEFTEWLAREMPPGTVISDPRWWAPRIAARFAAGQQSTINPAADAIQYHNAVGPIDAMAAAFSAMDNNDTELEEWPQRAIDALALAGWAVVPYALPYEVLGEAGVSGVFETGNPKHGWDWLVAKTRIGPHGPPVATPQPAGCGACGDDCKDRGSCRLADESPRPAGAVPAWFGELPAPISNPEAWPANYAGGYNDALNMCYDVIRGHAPQPMTTQGEAVENVDHFSSLREAVLAFDENPNGQNSTAVIMRARRLTGSQP